MSKLSHSSVSNVEEEYDQFDFDNAPKFGGSSSRDATMKVNPKRSRNSLTTSGDFRTKKKRDNSSNRGGDKLHESGSK